MSKHTPGPWEVRPGEPWVIAKAYGDMKSVVHLNLPVRQSEEQQANSRLIAAAPELLNALIRIMPFVDCIAVITPEDFIEYPSALAAAKAAIAKATGGEA